MTENFASRYVSDNIIILATGFFLALNLVPQLQAQDNPDSLYTQQLELIDLESFDDPSENWQIAGELFMDTYKEDHVKPQSGTGILVNTAEGESPQDIYTGWTHGDIDLELDFMMAKGSNSGIYLQGRYELQLMDSWGVKNPAFSDLGGIYQWWEDGVGKGGIAPQVNAARAPGVWQHLEIKFRAPRFNEQGEKIAHARLEEVILNGQAIHTDVKLVHPTGGAISNEEVRQGPLRFQGDHGPVAFRNIEYRRYDNDPLQLQDISYKYYEKSSGEDGDEGPASAVDPNYLVDEGITGEIGLDELQSNEEFAIVYRSEFRVKAAGTYFFQLLTEGGNRLSIDGEPLIENSDGWNNDTEAIELSEGSHTLEIAYFRGESGSRPALSLTVQGPGVEPHPLNAASAFPASLQNPDLPKIVDPTDQPILMHGFMEADETVHPHSGAVGYPEDINFGINLNNGSILKLWKGTFLDLSTMWVSRGGGNLSLNEDAAIALSEAPQLAVLGSRDKVWPDSLQPDQNYHFDSYQIGDNGDLTFNYSFAGTEVEDRIYPEKEGRELARSITFRNSDSAGDIYFKIAEGEEISELPNGLYQVNDKTYLINVDDQNGSRVFIRRSDNKDELLFPVSGSEQPALDYSYIW